MKRTLRSGTLLMLAAIVALHIVPSAALAEPAPGIPLPGVVPPHISETVEQLFALDEARVSAVSRDLAVQDVARCDIETCVDPGRAWLSGSTRLQFDVVNGRADLLLNEGLTVLSLTDAAGRELAFERSARSLVVPLGLRDADAPVELIITYEGIVRPAFGSDKTGDDLIILLGSDCWYPSPREGDRSFVRAVVRHPGAYATVFSGALAGMATPPASRPGPCSLGDVWEAPDVERASVVVGHLSGSWNILGELFIGSHRFSGSDDTSAGSAPVLRPPDLGMKQPLRFLESCFGPYPLTWLHIVTVPHGTLGEPAVSGPGLIIVETDPGDVACRRPPDPDLYLIELASAWWRHAHGSGSFLADGLAAHMEIQWLESVRGEEDASRRRSLRRQQYLRAVTDSGGSAPLSLCLGPDAVCDERISLGRGGAMMGIVAALLGPDGFCDLVSGLANDAGQGTPGLRSFAAALTAAAGSDMDWLLYEWVSRGDLPVYALDYETAPARGGYIVHGTVRQLVEPFRTPLPLTVDLGGWVYDEWIAVNSAEQSFEFRTDLEPLSVVIDASNIVPRVESADQARVHFELGRRAAAENLWAEAVDQFGAAVALVPRRALYRARYGEALVRVGRPDDGLAALLEAVERDTENADYVFRAGILSGRIGDFRGAVELLERHTALRPDEPRGHVELAIALVELGRLPEALSHLDRCPALLDETPDDLWLERYHIAVGRYSEARGERELAVSAYEAALEANPVSDEARRRLAGLGAH